MATLLPTLTITTALSATRGAIWRFREQGARNLALQCVFTYGSGGTTTDAYVQTSFDGGTTWVDVANFHFTTSSLTQVCNLSSGTPVTTIFAPTDGSIANTTVKDGVLGDLICVKYKSTGTYAGGTTLQVTAASNSRMAQHPA